MRSDREDLIMEVCLSLYRLKEAGIMVYLCWVPAHVGNEGAHKLAKKSTRQDGGGC